MLKRFGISLASAVYLEAFVIGTLLLPAVLELLGRITWLLSAGSIGDSHESRSTPSQPRAGARPIQPSRRARDRPAKRSRVGLVGPWGAIAGGPIRAVPLRSPVAEPHGAAGGCAGFR